MRESERIIDKEKIKRDGGADLGRVNARGRAPPPPTHPPFEIPLAYIVN